jgi:hypothetical protein
VPLRAPKPAPAGRRGPRTGWRARPRSRRCCPCRPRRAECPRRSRNNRSPAATTPPMTSGHEAGAGFLDDPSAFRRRRSGVRCGFVWSFSGFRRCPPHRVPPSVLRVIGRVPRPRLLVDCVALGAVVFRMGDVVGVLRASGVVHRFRRCASSGMAPPVRAHPVTSASPVRAFSTFSASVDRALDRRVGRRVRPGFRCPPVLPALLEVRLATPPSLRLFTNPTVYLS